MKTVVETMGSIDNFDYQYNLGLIGSLFTIFFMLFVSEEVEFDGLFEIVLILITILIGMIAAIFPAVVAYKFDIAKVLKNKI